MLEKVLGYCGKANESSPLNRTFNSKSPISRYLYEGSVSQLGVLIPITVNDIKLHLV